MTGIRGEEKLKMNRRRMKSWKEIKKWNRSFKETGQAKSCRNNEHKQFWITKQRRAESVLYLTRINASRNREGEEE